MLEQARKANIGLVLAHQSISQSRGGKGGSNIADPLMVNTATKLIWTSFREDAAKFAGSMQVKPEDILNLPQFTFGMHSRKRGFTPVRGERNALRHIPKREDNADFKVLMEERYGSSKQAETDEPGQEKEEDQERQSEEEPRKNDSDELGDPPDVETI